MLDHSEDRLLEEALGAIAGQGRLGAKFAARFLKHDVHEIELRLPLGFDLALERVRGAWPSRPAPRIRPCCGTGPTWWRCACWRGPDSPR